MKESFTIVYFNPDCFMDTDVTVLHHLAKEFNVIWFYYYESIKAGSMRYNPEVAKEYADKYGLTLVIVDPKMRRRNIRNYFFFKEVAKKINAYNPDIVYACNIFPFWTYCYSKIKCNNKVLGIHDVSLHSYNFSIGNHLIQLNKEYWLKRFNHIFTFSQNQHDLLKEKMGKDSTMVGMSCKGFGESTKVPEPLKNGVKLLFFGSIEKYKGLDVLIKVLEELKNEGINNLILTIAGKGSYWEDCRKWIKNVDLYNLQVRFIKNDEIPDLMKSNHFLVLPYRNATQSGPLVTALYYQLPIIAPNYGCFKDTYDKQTAILYEEGKFKEALKRVSAIQQNDYDAMCAHVKALKENSSEEKIAQNYIEAFSNILYKTKN